MSILEGIHSVIRALAMISGGAVSICTAIGHFVRVVSAATYNAAMPFVFLVTEVTRMFKLCQRNWNLAISTANEIVGKMRTLPVIAATCVLGMAIYWWHPW
jgi:hypothetical protein